MMTGYSSIEFPLFGYQWVQASDLAASLLSWLAYMGEVLVFTSV